MDELNNSGTINKKRKSNSFRELLVGLSHGRPKLNVFTFIFFVPFIFLAGFSKFIIYLISGLDNIINKN